MNWRWQKRWEIGGWLLMLTYGQSMTIGIGTGYGWIATRVNGFWISLGPITFDVQPPMPKWMKDELDHR